MSDRQHRAWPIATTMNDRSARRARRALAPTSCSSATSSRPSSAATSAAVTARSRRCCAGSTRCRGGSSPLALHLFARERRALAVAGRLGIAPPLLFAGRRALVRSWIDGVPLHIAKPYGDVGYFRSAKAALRKLHRAGHLPQRSRQGAELAARPRRQRLPHRLPARRAVFAPRIGSFGSPPTKTCVTCSSTSAATCPRRSPPTERRVLARKSLPDPHLDGDRQEGLLRDHARPVPLHRSRRRRAAARARRAAHRRAPQDATRRCATS